MNPVIFPISIPTVVREVYRYIPSQKWDSERILYTSWWDKNLKKINHSEGAEYIDFTN